MKSVHFFCVLIWLSACGTTDFSGQAQDSKAQPSVAETPTPSPISTPIASSTPTPSPTLTLPQGCDNDFVQVGITSGGLTYKLLSSPVDFDTGAAQCQGVAANAKMTFVGQVFPDEILKCRLSLGTLWLSPANEKDDGSWAPKLQGTDDSGAKHWVICYYQKS